MTNSKFTKEKRRHFRVPITAKVRTVKTDGPFFYFTKNISVGGLFLQTDQEIPVGTVLELEVAVQGIKDLIRVKGKVTRIDRKDDGSVDGIGVQFVDVKDDMARHIKDFVEEKEDA